MNSLARIKERKLFQWAVAYLAGAWVVLELLGVLAQPFAWPDLVLRAATVLLAMGFFGVLVLAWYHGDQGRQSVGGMELLMLAGILLIAGVAVTLVSRGGESPLSGTAHLMAGAPGSPDSSAALPAERGAPGPAPAAERGSIAVLPFVNMSSDPEQEYFSDGLTEELLNVLAQIPELRVAARTSTFSFKGQKVSVDSVGRALRVAHVLEGSVRKSGSRVRITAQLIDARNGFHLWSQTYDRGLQDVFAVQDEISKAVAAQLRIELAGDAALVKQQTADPEAHALLLRGIAVHRQGSREAFAEAERLFREAIRRDPGYAQAHAQLSNTVMLRAYTRHIPMTEGYAEARAAAERALTLDPDESEAHAVLGRIADAYDWDFAAAEEHFRRALASNPGDGRVRSLRAWLLMRLGQREEALGEALRAVQLDPLSMPAYNNLGAMFVYAGQPQRGMEAFQAAVALAPDAGAVVSNLALSFSEAGRHDDAVRAAERAQSLDSEEQFTLSTLGYVYARAGRRAEAERALASLEAQPDASPYLIASVYAGLGDAERAFQMLERAVNQRDDSVPDLGVDPVFDALRSDPRMQRLLQRMGLG